MKIGIIGLGIMGGSIAKKLKKQKDVDYIIAYDINEDDLKIAKKENIIGEYTSKIDNSFSNLDYIFICTPVKYTISIAKKLEEYVTDNCLVIDIGSTKKNIVLELEKMKFNYVGCHPMTGKEKSGFRYADAHLYDNSYFLITITDTTKEDNIQKCKEIILKLGANPYIIPLEKHDFIVSVISHVPHVVAFSLVNMAKELEDENNNLRTLAAGGFKDITRIASSSPSMWQSIFLDNKEEVLSTITCFKNSIEKLEKYIIDEDSEKINEFILSSKNFRDSIDNLRKDNEICLKIKNTPGELERIISILSKNDINIINLTIIDDIDEKHGTLKLYFKNTDIKEKALDCLKNESIK